MAVFKEPIKLPEINSLDELKEGRFAIYKGKVYHNYKGQINVNNPIYGFKNRIINGDFRVRQRGASAIISSQDFIVDRFQSQTNGSIIIAKDLSILPDSVSLVDNVDPFGDGSGVALWKFDGNANDAGGKYNGTWNGTEQYDKGIFGQAAKFDGNSKIDLGRDLDFVIDNKKFSISIWFYLTQYTDNDGYDSMLMSKHYNSDDGSFIIYYYRAITTGSRIIEFNKNDVSLNNWHNIVFIYDNGLQQLYLDGVLKASDNNGNISTTDDNWVISGFNTNNHYKIVNGLIDQVRIFNRALTEEEVQKLYLEESKVIEKHNTITIYTTSKPSDYTTQTIKHLIYRFEGQHLYDLIKEGKKVTLSFKFNAKKPGKYAVALINKTVTGNYETILKTFTYSGNEEEKVSITFDLSLFKKEVRNDENLGCELVICGYTQNTNLVGNEGYNVGEKICTSDCIEINDNDSISITEVQLEEGEVATEFEYVPYDIQLLRCMRYYERLSGIFPAYVNETNMIVCSIPCFPKRILPTLKTDFNTANREPGDQTDLVEFTGIYPFAIPNSSGFSLNIKTSVNLTVGDSSQCSAVDFPYLELDAEL